MSRQTTIVRVQNLCCRKEADLASSLLSEKEGFLEVQSNVASKSLLVKHDPSRLSTKAIIDSLNAAHLGAALVDSSTPVEEESGSLLSSLWRWTQRHSLAVILCLLFPLLLVSSFFLSPLEYTVTAWAVLILTGGSMVVRGVRCLINRGTADMHVLMSVGMLGAAASGSLADAAAIPFIVNCSEMIHSFMLDRMDKSIGRLLLSAPPVALRISERPGGGEVKEPVAVSVIEKGDVIRLRQGDLVPVDGEVIVGTAYVDEAKLTGEAAPQRKEAGSKMFSGTAVQQGGVDMKALAIASESAAARISAAVKEASLHVDTEIGGAVDRFAAVYTPLVVLFAFLWALLPLLWDLLGARGRGGPKFDATDSAGETSGENVWLEAFDRGLFVLLGGCPCALVAAAPAVYLQGLAVCASSLQVFLRRASVLEAAGAVTAVALDKTGTLTEGDFSIVDEFWCGGVGLGQSPGSKGKYGKGLIKQQDRGYGEEEASPEDLTSEEIFRLIAAVEARAAHPLAALFLNRWTGCAASFFESAGPEGRRLPEVTEFNEVPGKGVMGRVALDVHADENTQRLLVCVGNKRLMEDMKVRVQPSAVAWVTERERTGRAAVSGPSSVVFVAIGRDCRALFVVEDRLRPAAREALLHLQSLGSASVILTGDSHAAAQKLHRQLMSQGVGSVQKVMGGLNPSDKEVYVRGLKTIADRGAGRRSPWGMDRPLSLPFAQQQQQKKKDKEASPTAKTALREPLLPSFHDKREISGSPASRKNGCPLSPASHCAGCGHNVSESGSPRGSPEFPADPSAASAARGTHEASLSPYRAREEVAEGGRERETSCGCQEVEVDGLKLPDLCDCPFLWAPIATRSHFGVWFTGSRGAKSKGRVAMVGDGINDAPALARADVGVALAARAGGEDKGGAGFVQQLAVEAADVVVVGSDVSAVPRLIQLGISCKARVVKNVVIALALKLTALLGGVIWTFFDAAGPPVWAAVLADAISLLAVLLNSLCPLEWRYSGALEEETGVAPAGQLQRPGRGQHENGEGEIGRAERGG